MYCTDELELSSSHFMIFINIHFKLLFSKYDNVLGMGTILDGKLMDMKGKRLMLLLNLAFLLLKSCFGADLPDEVVENGDSYRKQVFINRTEERYNRLVG